ncbi:MAG: outer membrane lipid asymmetry maintenance protein MlaD [Proteobacteria bacterium]|nr:outer membrane lipid asymmetry maintenance protein MlaD [Pseudomonadota bacterium]MBS0573697.1 outer membrane lipid asymmetry maintenance protein MlaD [Pseudomonadota bacterium]
MAENLTEVLTGAGVLAVAIGFAAYAGLAGTVGRTGGSYPLHASFRSVDGVSVGTEVRMAGVKIGAVTGLALNPKTYLADTSFTVKDGIEIPDDSTVLISSEGLMGGNFVEIQPGGSPTNYAAGAEIEDTQGAVGLIQLLLKFVGKAASGDGAKDQPAGGAESAP